LNHFQNLFAGNKADLEEHRAVSAEEAQAYAAENGIYFVETSAKTAANVSELFVDLARNIPKVEAAPKPPQAGIALDSQPAAAPKTSCCGV
jgi:Ras-related protein Rab-5C